LHLHIIDCAAAGVSTERLIELVRTEIAPRALDLANQGATADDLTCEVRLCDGAAHAAALSLFREGSVVSRLTVNLSDVAGDSRPRTLAVILAEMLVAASSLPGAESKAAATPPDDNSTRNDAPAPAPEPRVASLRLIEGRVSPISQRRARWYASAGGWVREYSRPGAPLFGAWVGMTYRRVTGELVLGRSTTAGPIGDVNLSYAALATAFDVFEASSKPLIASRIRLEGGDTWASGSPSDGFAKAHSAFALTMAAMAEVTLRFVLVRATTGQFKLVGGYSSGLSATENGQAVASTSGWVIGVGLGLDFALNE
jgi:hypothetical protein